MHVEVELTASDAAYLLSWQQLHLAEKLSVEEGPALPPELGVRYTQVFDFLPPDVETRLVEQLAEAVANQMVELLAGEVVDRLSSPGAMRNPELAGYTPHDFDPVLCARNGCVPA